MKIILEVFLGLLAGGVLIVLLESIKIPKTMHIKAIMKFNEFHKMIMNVEGKVFDDEWNIVDGEKEKGLFSNVYFFLWPIYKTHLYTLTYTKQKRMGEEEEGDVVIWKNEDTKICIVSRKHESDHIVFRSNYPTITSQLDTKGLTAVVNIFTDNILEARNPERMFFGVDDYMRTAMEILDACSRGLVAKKGLSELNEFNSEETGEFNTEMQKTNKIDEVNPGLWNFGYHLRKSAFKDFQPGDDQTKLLMKAYSDVEVHKQQGKANFEKQKGDTKAFLLKSNAEIGQAKKFKVETGTAKVDENGNITELIPDPNTKVTANAIAALKDVKGTVVIEGPNKGITPVLDVTNRKEQE